MSAASTCHPLNSLDPNHNNQPSSIEEAQRLLQWIEFKKQDGKGSLASYGGNGNRMDVFAALDDATRIKWEMMIIIPALWMNTIIQLIRLIIHRLH